MKIVFLLFSFVFPIKIGTGDTSFGYAQEKQKIKAGSLPVGRQGLQPPDFIGTGSSCRTTLLILYTTVASAVVLYS